MNVHDAIIIILLLLFVTPTTLVVDSEGIIALFLTLESICIYYLLPFETLKQPKKYILPPSLSIAYTSMCELDYCMHLIRHTVLNGDCVENGTVKSKVKEPMRPPPI
ncbi:unnamed protein product [Rhizophagus irregularis]|nr:unnamed protein product [Rhizophagus irregularis]